MDYADYASTQWKTLSDLDRNYHHNAYLTMDYVINSASLVLLRSGPQPQCRPIYYILMTRGRS